MKDDNNMLISAAYIRSVFQDFESYLRTEVDLVEDDIRFRLVLEQYNSSLITYEIQPGIYTFKDLSKAVYNILQLEYPKSGSELVIEFDDITRKTKLVVDNGIIAVIINKQSFFSIVLGFTSGWVHKHYNKYTSQKVVNLSTTNKIHLKCDVIAGSVVNGLRQPIIYSFV